MTAPPDKTENLAPPPPQAPGASFFGRRTQPMTPNEALQPQPAPQPPEPKKRKRRPVLSALSGIMSLALVLAALAGLGLVVAQRQLRSPGPLTGDKIVVIAPGTDAGDIIDQLEREGVIASALTFNLALFVEQTRSKLKAGEYSFRQSASLQDVMDTLVSGRAILHSITIPEGLTSEQIVARLRENDVLVGDIREIPKEGTLLPETYKFSRGFSRGQAIDLMRAAQVKALAEIWARRANDLPVRSPSELVTLASIVEKETGRADERPRVAGVFVNRLGKRMKLQSDPTIVYGLVQGKGTLGRGITRAELEKPTPYNTYVIEGLPPGPIANPGKAAMEAVANPSRTKDLFFVADGTGGHAFADSLDAHNKNVLRWRQIEKDAKDAKDTLSPDIAPAPAAVPGAKPDVKGGLDGAPSPVFGALPSFFDEAAEARQRELAQKETAARQIIAAKLGGAPAPSSGARAPPAAAYAPAAAAPQKPAAAVSAYALGPDIEEISALVPGGREPTANSAFFGDVEGDANVNSATFPVSASRRADQKARAAQYGLGSGADTLPATERAASAPAPDTAARPRPKAFDASEGTALDPLRNKSFDLTSAKTVPSLR